MTPADRARLQRVLNACSGAVLIRADRVAERSAIIHLIEEQGYTVGLIPIRAQQNVWHDALKENADVLVTAGLELLPERDQGDWLAALNTSRDILFDLGRPILFLVDEAHLTRISRQCPDFLSRVSEVLGDPGVADEIPVPPRDPFQEVWHHLMRRDVGMLDPLWVDPKNTSIGPLLVRMERACALQGPGFLGVITAVPGATSTLVRKMAGHRPLFEGRKTRLPSEALRATALFSLLRALPARADSRPELELTNLLQTTLGRTDSLNPDGPPLTDLGEYLGRIEDLLLEIGRTVLRDRCSAALPLVSLPLYSGDGAENFLRALKTLLVETPVLTVLVLAPHGLTLPVLKAGPWHRHEILPALQMEQPPDRAFCRQILETRGLPGKPEAIDRLLDFADGLLDDLLFLAREALLAVEGPRPELNTTAVNAAIQPAQLQLRQKLKQLGPHLAQLAEIDGQTLDALPTDPARVARRWIDQRLLTRAADDTLRLHRAVAELVN